MDTSGHKAVPHHRPPVIGVFDSGAGGLTIFHEIEKHLPGASYVYCSDNANFPYGPKTEEEVVACVRQACTRLIANYGLDLLVVACNTASTVALPVLRSEFHLPVVGVVPAIKPAAHATRTGVIGLLATPGTVRRSYVQKLVSEFAEGCEVISVGSSRLVKIAEDKAHSVPVDIEEVRHEIAPLFGGEQPPGRRLDAVVLGCTHFPLLLDELNAAAAWPVRWIDSGAAVAARTRAVLIDHGFHLDEISSSGNVKEKGRRTAVVTCEDAGARRAQALFERYGFKDREILKL